MRYVPMIETKFIENIVDVPKVLYRDVVEVVPEVRYNEVVEEVPKIVIEDCVRHLPQPARRIDSIANLIEKFERILQILEAFDTNYRIVIRIAIL